MSLDTVFTYLFPFFFVGMWFAVVTILRNLAGMSKGLAAEHGTPIRSSRTGSASINGVGARGCVKLKEYADGYLVAMTWLFGGGQLWLPKDTLRIGDAVPRRLLIPPSRTLISGMNQVILYDRLVDFVQPPGSSQ